MVFVPGFEYCGKRTDRSMILRLARWRGAKESFEIFETCWQDLSLNLTLFSWAERVGLIEPIKSQYFSPLTFINSIMRQSTDCNKM